MERGPLGPGARGRRPRRRAEPEGREHREAATAATGRGGSYMGRPYLLATIHQDTGEMRELASTLGLRLLLQVYQSRNRPHPGTFLGRGRLESLRRQLDEWRAGILPEEWVREGAHYVPVRATRQRAARGAATAGEAGAEEGAGANGRRGEETHGDGPEEAEEPADAEGKRRRTATAWGGARWGRSDAAGDPPGPGDGDLLLVLDEDVRPGVLFNLEERLKVEVWDRTRLILEIFSQHAHLKEASLQVELAKLQYEVPLIQEAIHRKMGSERPGFMGGGEYAVADYRDFIKRRMRTIRDELEQVRHDREVRRKVRRDRFYQVALAGYTNAGKSSLLAALTGADTLREGALFTTLSTMTRRLELPSGRDTQGEKAPTGGRDGEVPSAGPPPTGPNVSGGNPSVSYARPILLTDTVGFIRALPSWLLDAFHATLEEIALSDVVLLVADASDPPAVLVEKVRVCQEELAHLDVTCPVVVVLNKADRLDAPARQARRETLLREAEVRRSMVIWTSARTAEGLRRLVTKVQAQLPPMVAYRLVTAADEPGLRLVSRLYGWGSVDQVDYGIRTVAVGTCDPLHWKDLQAEARETGARLSRL